MTVVGIVGTRRDQALLVDIVRERFVAGDETRADPGAGRAHVQDGIHRGRIRDAAGGQYRHRPNRLYDGGQQGHEPDLAAHVASRLDPLGDDDVGAIPRGLPRLGDRADLHHGHDAGCLGPGNHLGEVAPE